MTVCTNSRYQKRLIVRYMNETADSLDELPFKLHDFGYRGASSVEVGPGLGTSDSCSTDVFPFRAQVSETLPIW